MRFENENLLTEMACDPHVAYLLHDVNAFYPTGFEVLQNMDNSGFLRCVKMQFNADLQFMYLTRSDGVEYKPLCAVLNGLHPDAFLRIVRNLLEVMLHADETGFLGVQNIVVSTDRIFVDPATANIRLIYLPIAAGYVAETKQNVADELCAELIRTIYAHPELENTGVRRLRQAVANTMPSLRQIYSTAFGDLPPAAGPAAENADTRMILQAVQHAEPVRVTLPKGDLLAGTKVGTGELELHGNPYISGRHCRFSYREGQYYLADIGSSNGTFLNGRKLERDMPQQLHDGDMIRIANSLFRVTRQEGGEVR